MWVCCLHARVIHKKSCRLAGRRACLLSGVLIVKSVLGKQCFLAHLTASWVCVRLSVSISVHGVGWEASSALGKVGWVYWGRKCWSVTQSSAFIQPASKICLCRILSAQCLSDTHSLWCGRLVCRTRQKRRLHPRYKRCVKVCVLWRPFDPPCISDVLLFFHTSMDGSD